MYSSGEIIFLMAGELLRLAGRVSVLPRLLAKQNRGGELLPIRLGKECVRWGARDL
jgi:hypothetical protein